MDLSIVRNTMLLVWEGMYEPKDLENIDKETEYVLLHESLHWVLGKFVCESASFWLDNENVSEFIHSTK